MHFISIVSLLYIIQESAGNFPTDWINSTCERRVHSLNLEMRCSIDNATKLFALSDTYRDTLIVLNLSLSGFAVLPSSALHYDNLTVLRIRAPDLVSVKNDAFFGLQGSLSSLELSNSRLREIPVSAISGLPELKLLDMRGNQILYLNASLYNMSLHTLILRHNLITSIERDVLPESLEHLDLYGNRLFSLSGALKGNLTFLDISNNNISSLDDVLNEVPKLECLVASNNHINNIDHCFSSVRQLMLLYLSYNQIHEIKNGLLGLSKLKHLVLNANGLRNIEDTAFRDLNALESVDLNTNNLTTLDEHLFDCVVSLRNLDISSNHLSRLNFLASDNALDGSSAEPFQDLDTANCHFRDYSALKFLNIKDNRLRCCRVERIINFLLSNRVDILGNPCRRGE